jgi:hypothetical protein
MAGAPMTDIRKMLEDGRCKPNHGCNVATFCMCAALEDAADEIERLLKENRNMNTTITNDAIMIFERDQEIERLRAALRVNGLRWGHTHAEIDALLTNGHNADD